MRRWRWCALALLIFMANPALGLCLPEFSSTYNFSGSGGNGQASCEMCHINNIRFEKNIYVDVRLAHGPSLMDKNGVVVIPWRAGESVSLEIVTGLIKQDMKGEVAGWYLDLPNGSLLGPGFMQYGYLRINYERPGEFTNGQTEYQALSKLDITIGRNMAPTQTELWVAVGEKATGKYPGASERKRTLGLKRYLVKWMLEVK